jgi:hypothetical protein
VNTPVISLSSDKTATPALVNTSSAAASARKSIAYCVSRKPDNDQSLFARKTSPTASAVSLSIAKIS